MTDIPKQSDLKAAAEKLKNKERLAWEINEANKEIFWESIRLPLTRLQDGGYSINIGIPRGPLRPGDIKKDESQLIINDANLALAKYIRDKR